MTPRHARYAVCAFLLLSTSVAGNIMFLQDPQDTSRGQSVRAQNRAAAERAKRPAVEPTTEPTTDHAYGVGPVIVGGPPPRTGASGLPQVDTRYSVKPQSADGLGAAGNADPPEIVAAIQRDLQSRGYEPGKPDGVAGAVTRAAIMAWEFDQGLPPTGEPTDTLMRAIKHGLSKPLASQIQMQFQALPKDRKARTEALVRTTQSALSALGYNAGRVTGRVNDDTERSIREFELDQNMPSSGRISGPLVARLITLTGIGRPVAAR